MTELTIARRAPRRSRTPVDVTSFADDVDAAMEAFRHDVTYAVSMARSAVSICRKREVWSARKQQRDQAAA